MKYAVKINENFFTMFPEDNISEGFMEITEDVYNNSDMYFWQDGELVVNPNYEAEQANIIRTFLKEGFNYELKKKYAYTGVKFDYTIDNNTIELVFETNKDSISLINSYLIKILTLQISKVDNWKCRKTVEPFEPVSVNFTVEQFQKITQFGEQMIQQAFLIESQINSQIDTLTVEQLNNKEYIENFKTEVVNAYTTINTKIQDLFI